MFLIFGGERYYASGGGFDLLHKTTTKEDAVEKAESFLGKKAVFEVVDWSDDREDDTCSNIEWTHVLDVSSGKIIANFGENPYGNQRQAIEIRGA